jgi:hypothetical protein
MHNIHMRNLRRHSGCRCGQWARHGCELCSGFRLPLLSLESVRVSLSAELRVDLWRRCCVEFVRFLCLLLDNACLFLRNTITRDPVPAVSRFSISHLGHLKHPCAKPSCASLHRCSSARLSSIWSSRILSYSIFRSVPRIPPAHFVSVCLSLSLSF